MTVGSNFAPAEWPITAVRGDTLREQPWALEDDGTPMVLVSAVAQVRERRDRSSTLVLDLAAAVSGADVTIGPVAMDVDAGVYWWDLEITTADGPLTVLAGTCTVLADVSVP